MAGTKVPLWATLSVSRAHRAAEYEDALKKLDGPECPICRGWNCTVQNPHAAWIKGTPQNTLIRADAEARKASAR